MADIHIVRPHGLGLAGARRLAFRWAEVARKKLDVECRYEEGGAHDVLRFQRPGVHGTLKVGAERFELDARLGLLLGVFRGKIESEIVRNLDELLAHEDPLHAFEQGLARHEAKREARQAARHGRNAEPHKGGGKPAEPHKTAARPAEPNKAAAKPAAKGQPRRAR